MVRISPIAEDWVDKGCHIHVDSIELAVHPDHLGGVVFRKVFSSTSDDEFDIASRIATAMLQDAGWCHKLRDTLERAMIYLLGVTGQKMPKARGRLCEFNFLMIALDRIGGS